MADITASDRGNFGNLSLRKPPPPAATIPLPILTVYRTSMRTYLHPRRFLPVCTVVCYIVSVRVRVSACVRVAATRIRVPHTHTRTCTRRETRTYAHVFARVEMKHLNVSAYRLWVKRRTIDR